MSRKKIATIIVVLFAPVVVHAPMVAGRQRGPDGPAGFGQTAGLKLEASVDSSDSGRDPELKVTLFNEGAKTVWANRRMAWSSAGLGTKEGEIEPEIYGPDGQRIPFTCKNSIDAASANCYVLLRPREFVGRTLPIESSCVDLSRPGRYSVIVRYKDGGGNIEGLDKRVERLQGELVAPKTTFSWPGKGGSEPGNAKSRSTVPSTKRSTVPEF